MSARSRVPERRGFTVAPAQRLAAGAGREVRADVNPIYSGDETTNADVRCFVADDLLAVAVVPSGDGAQVTVSPTGDIDSVTAPALRSALLSVLPGPCARVIVDLDGVTFLNSAGLTVLAEAHHRAQVAGISFGVCGGRRAVRRVLRITGLDDLLAVPPDR
jgi:anti-sigma B factor antagonist